MAELLLRAAAVADIDAVCDLVFTYGPAEFNYLPIDEVRSHLQQIPNPVHAVLAYRGPQLVGAATFVHNYPDGPIDCGLGDDAIYIAEVVVHEYFRGRGVGQAMLGHVVSQAERHGSCAVYIDRHTDNLASEAMMISAGYDLVLRYPDPKRRTNGSGETSVHVRKVR